jgi:hypothetical protein
MPARRAFVLGVVVGAGVLAAALAGVGLAAGQDDGGTGVYSGSGTTLTFSVVNSGTTAWQYIVFKLPPGSSFVSGKVTAGGSAPCTVGSFVPGSGELECGGFSPPVARHGQVTVTVTINAPVAPCGAPIEFYVNSTGKPPYPRASNLTFSGSCRTPGKNCDKELAAVAAAKAEVAADEAWLGRIPNQLKSLLEKWSLAKKDFDEFEKLIPDTAGMNALFIGDEVTKALANAESAYRAVQGMEGYVGNHLTNDKKKLAEAEQALKSCQEGSSSRRLAQAFRIDAPAASGTEQAALAGARARAAQLAIGAGRLERTHLRQAQKYGHAAVTALHKALGQSSLRKYRPKLVPILGLLRQGDTIMIGAVHMLDRLESSAKAAAAGVPVAKAALAKCQATPPPPATVSISEDDTWAYSTAIGKANICVNIRTTPAQASISASVTGPSNYTATLPKTPLHADGTRQVGAEITQPGAYTDTLTVYDATGTQTATTTNTFTVKAPPQDGPPPTFGPPCPKPTQ